MRRRRQQRKPWTYGKPDTWLVNEIEGAFHMPLERLLFRKYWKEGKSYRLIGDELGCSHATVAMYMRKLRMNVWSVARDYAADHEAELIMQAQRLTETRPVRDEEDLATRHAV